MKKLLLATTALAASAGLAHAQSSIAVGASAEMGISKYGDEDAKFHQDLTITFAGTAVTDGGLTFSFTGELADDNGSDRTNGNGVLGSEDVTVSGAFGSLTLGDTDGGYDWALNEVAIGDAIADDHTAHAGYNGNSGIDNLMDDQILRYDNSFGDIGIAVSLEMKDGEIGKNSFGIGATYSMAMGDGTSVGIGVGYGAGSRIASGEGPVITPASPRVTTRVQRYAPYVDANGIPRTPSVDDDGDVIMTTGTNPVPVHVIPAVTGENGQVTTPEVRLPLTANGLVRDADGDPVQDTVEVTPAVAEVRGDAAPDADIWGVSVRADLANGLTTVLNYSNGWQSAVAAEESHTALGVAYSIDAVTVSANYGKYGSGENGFGFALNYSLGLGSQVRVGYGRGEDASGDSTSTWSAGVGLSF